MKKKHMETALIHHGYTSEEHKGSLTPPLFQTSTFTFETAQQGEASFAGVDPSYIYSRLGNPTVKLFEERMAVLEEGEEALAFGSGMAAISATLIGFLKAGDHIICSNGLYGCTYGFLEVLEEKFMITHSFCDMETEADIENKIRPNTKLVFVETPINPTMKLIDLKQVIRVAKRNDLLVIVDNTFCSPYLQRPLELGCDAVVHSATKYIGGHGDVVAGVTICKTKALAEKIRPMRKDIGGIMAPFDAWLLLRGLKTLAVRMDRHCDNAEKIVSFLKNHDAVEGVWYPEGELASRQMKRGGGVISFSIKGGKEETQTFINDLHFITIAVSLGDTETLIQHPATMTHAAIPAELRQEMGIYDNLIRLSVGLESWEDIVSDLEQALKKISTVSNQ
ncbi:MULTISPECIES: methionine gamma-lyase [Bacillus]|uniref:L-methionine gamma-lyase n=2 Tax=Bacillus cereus group TaxID=86661 RepID=A0A2A7DCC2_BACAN|nr:MULTISPECIES: methionine gamma-lyase [Bacillus]MCP1165774.1 methionine gamma-lyase [Bacillus sp. 1813sda1]MDC7975558.1 methionine gamma-lyase [Bacillus sp. BLCC-B18]OTW66547.1 methionine gamma-lyase [Bacillus thuringiensis serovar coreanensis]OTX43174.1 methionine gamma-lyase [Bacillus thuringiensis serovar sooncheon]OTX51480.1 methionine gamma-lyase [Bacillus thuringiensis serovar guiyangiensis]